MLSMYLVINCDLSPNHWSWFFNIQVGSTQKVQLTFTVVDGAGAKMLVHQAFVRYLPSVLNAVGDSFVIACLSTFRSTYMGTWNSVISWIYFYYMHDLHRIKCNSKPWICLAFKICISPYLLNLYKIYILNVKSTI